MICPNCGSVNMSIVLDVRENMKRKSTRRRRECTACGCRYITFEQVDKIYKRRKAKDGKD